MNAPQFTASTITDDHDVCHRWEMHIFTLVVSNDDDMLLGNFDGLPQTLELQW
jgi:hypothetical protein